MSDHFSEHPSINNVSHQFLMLQLEYSATDVWPVQCMLLVLEFPLNLFPIRIARHGDEKIRPSEPSANCHGILTFLTHVTITARVGCRHNSWSASLFKVLVQLISFPQSIAQARVQISTYLLLIILNPSKSLALELRPLIDDVLTTELVG